MKKSIIFLPLIFIFFLITTKNTKADLGCGGGCLGAQICAEAPDSISVDFVNNNDPSGCASSSSYPVPSPVLGGTSWCTDSIFNGMDTTTQCSTSVMDQGNYWFQWLTGSLQDNPNNAVCLLPGDLTSSQTIISTCTSTSIARDPISVLPPEIHTASNFVDVPSGGFSLPDMNLEAFVDCSATEMANTISHDMDYEIFSPNYPSNYPNNYSNTWTITHAGADQISVHFDFYDLESGDVISIYDKNDQLIDNLTYGFGDSYQSVLINGDTIKISFQTDDSATSSGWHIENYSYYLNSEATTVVVPKVKLRWNLPNYPSIDYYGLSIYKGWPNDSKIYSDLSYYNNNYLEYVDTNVQNNSTYTYVILFDIDTDSNGNHATSTRTEVEILCTNPNPNPLPAPGFNLDASLNNTDLTIDWSPVIGAEQYYIVQDLQPLNYFTTTYYKLIANNENNSVISGQTQMIDYLVDTTSSTMHNVNFTNSNDVKYYRVYAYIPKDFPSIVSYNNHPIHPWYYDLIIKKVNAKEFNSSLWPWNRKYPWDHQLVLSEEIIVHADGTIDDPTPADSPIGGTQPCSGPCTLDTDCSSGLSCISSQCRNSACSTEASCICSYSPVLVSSLTDALSSVFTTRASKHTLLYDIRLDTVVTNGSLLVTFPSDFNFGSLASSDITTTGGDVTWGSATVNSGNHTLVIPFTGTLNKDDNRITIEVGNTNLITNPIDIGRYIISLTSHNSIDGTGATIDDVSDEIVIRSFSEEGNSSLTDTLSVSISSYDSRHTLRYNIGNSVPNISNGSLKLVIPSEFDMSGLVDNDITILGGNVVWSSDKSIYSGGTQIGMSNSFFNNIVHAQGENSITFNFTGTLDGTNNMITIVIGNGNYINNPINVGPFTLNLTTYDASNGSGNQVESLIAVVNITGGVTVTATVPSSLTFTVLPVASAQSVNGTTTTTTSTASLINFGIIEPSLSKIAAHDLQVSTNSTNGFVVTLQSLSNFTSPGGDTISNFTGTNATPIDWSSPTTTHSFFGYTTSDYTLHDVAINRFQSNKWSGPSTTPSEVMYYTDPVEGTGEGLTRVGYQIEIDNLQPAGIYQTNLMYLCTATY